MMKMVSRSPMIGIPTQTHKATVGPYARYQALMSKPSQMRLRSQVRGTHQKVLNMFYSLKLCRWASLRPSS